MQSRENRQKLQFGQLFDGFKVKYLQIANFSETQVSFKLKVIFNANFRPKTKKKLLQPFLRALFPDFFSPIRYNFTTYRKVAQHHRKLFRIHQYLHFHYMYKSIVSTYQILLVEAWTDIQSASFKIYRLILTGYNSPRLRKSSSLLTDGNFHRRLVFVNGISYKNQLS